MNPPLLIHKSSLMRSVLSFRDPWTLVFWLPCPLGSNVLSSEMTSWTGPSGVNVYSLLWTHGRAEGWVCRWETFAWWALGLPNAKQIPGHEHHVLWVCDLQAVGIFIVTLQMTLNAFLLFALFRFSPDTCFSVCWSLKQVPQIIFSPFLSCVFHLQSFAFFLVQVHGDSRLSRF